MPLSSAQAAKRALYDGLKTHHAADTEVDVWHSYPTTDRPGYTDIIVGRVEVVQEWGALGASNPRRDEDIDITVNVNVFQGGTDEFAAEDRAWLLAESVQTVLSADLTLGGNVRYARPGRIEIDPRPYDDGRLASLTLVIHCRADNH